MKRLIACSLLSLIVMTTTSVVQAGVGIAYPTDPSGGWDYTYDGSQAVCGSGVSDSLDGSWNRNNGSSEWDCSAIDGGVCTGDYPGGVMSISTGTNPKELGVTYLRIQDPGIPPSYSLAGGGCGITNPANRKILFVRDLSTNAPNAAPDTVLDTGFTMLVRARVPTPSKTSFPLDNLYPANELANGPQPYPADGDGIVLQDNANGFISVRQAAGGKIGFALVVTNDTLGGLTATPKVNFRGLEVNGLNGTTINNTIDFNERPLQGISLDSTEWNEFWIVVTKDDSGLGTHTLLIYANGSLTPTIIHVTAASSSGETPASAPGSHLEMGSSQSNQSGAIDVDFVAVKFEADFPAGAGGVPPVISGVNPTPPTSGNTFWDTANGVSFSAASAGGKTIANGGVLLVLNGVDVSSGLAITGGGTANISAGITNLATNVIYTGTIQVTDSGGVKATFPLVFDTFSPAASIVIEAEDYNYTNSTSGADGAFLDNSTPGAYASFSGTEGTDFHDFTPLTGVYRTGDAVDTVGSNDTLRDYVNSAGAVESDVFDIEQGEWLNYTRTFAAGGKYNVYLRYLATVAQSVRLDLVTSDRTLPNQTMAPLGTFATANTGVAHGYAQLKDALGNNLVLNLSGIQTLRLTATTASLNLGLNYLVFVPTTSTGNGPTLGYAAPAPNSTTMLPDAPLVANIDNRDTSVVVGTISNFLDSVYVTPSSTIAATASGASIVYQPASPLVLNSAHTYRVSYGDGTKFYTNTYNFTVANLPVLSASWATAAGSGTSPGFSGIIHVHAGAQDLLFPNTAARAESQVAYQLIDTQTGQPFSNDAAGPNNDGTFTEAAVICYSNDGTDQSLYPPGLPFTTFPNTSGTLEHMAMAVTAHLDLKAGLNRFGVRSKEGFKLSSGPHFSRNGASLQVGDFEPGGAGEYGTSTSEFDFSVPSDGVYPFRLIWFQNGGPASVEWYSVNRSTGARTLINANTVGAVKAYMSRPLLTLTSQKILNPRISGSNVQFEYQTLFGYTYYVDYRDSVATGVVWTPDPTAGFAGDGSVHTFSVPSNASTHRFYHIRAQ